MRCGQDHAELEGLCLDIDVADVQEPENGLNLDGALRNRCTQHEGLCQRNLAGIHKRDYGHDYPEPSHSEFLVDRSGSRT